jgi:hypothetical protein
LQVFWRERLVTEKVGFGRVPDVIDGINERR